MPVSKSHAALLPVVLAVLVLAATPAAAGFLDRVHVGFESGSTIPIDPFQYSSNWDPSRGLGGILLVSLTPRVAVVARYEQDRHDFNGHSYSTWSSGGIVEGGTTLFRGFWVGVRRQHATGHLRAQGTIYIGGARREGRRAQVTFSGATQELGEPDQWVSGFGAGVGATLALPNFPDPYVEARMLWLEPEQQAPIRVGLVVP